MAPFWSPAVLSLSLVLLLIPSQAFKPRTLSQLPINTTLPGHVNTTLPGSMNTTTVLPIFPANLTGNLTGIQLPNATELLRIEQYVLNVSRPAVASFVDGTNTTIDCVPIQVQLAFSNLNASALRNLTLTPSTLPVLNTTLNSTSRANVASPVPVLNGTVPRILTPLANATTVLGVNMTAANVTGICPNGSVPVPRLTVADIARFGSLQAFLNSALNKGPPPNVSAPPSAANTGHEYATTYGSAGGGNPSAFYGMQTSMSVWAPFVEQPSGSREFSLSQIWVTGGSGTNLQTIEAGWQVDQIAYGDSNPHLFIYSTRSGYTDPVCYAGRKDCPANAATFVQVSKSVYPTITLQTSQVNGGNGLPNTVQYNILAFRDPANGNWWIKLQDALVEYYPGYLYTALGKSADTVSLGGEIVDTARLPGAAPGLAHTKTQMGSGEYAFIKSVQQTAYHYNFMYVNANNQLQSLDNIEVVNTNPQAYNPSCYSGELVPSNNGPNIFFFGGPGYGPQCLT